MRNIPDTIETNCPALNSAWAKYAAGLINRPGVLIPDTEAELNWHAFLGHSVDMQGFRAAEFAGVDSLSQNTALPFKSLKEREIGVERLAALWHVGAIRDHLLHVTTSAAAGTPMQPTYEVLETQGGSDGTSLAGALKAFPYRKTHKVVRALLQNPALLADSFGSSFRVWLKDTCRKFGADEFPPANFRQTVTPGGRQTPLELERALRFELEHDFYLVGPAMSPYMLCDWQLWLWNEGKTGWFANFKLDAFHQEFVRKHGGGLIPADEKGFTAWWIGYCPEIPPRLANECMWLAIESKLPLP